MFTGLVEEVAHVAGRRGQGGLVRLELRSEVVRGDLAVGDSVNHNGVCLTVVELLPQGYACDVMGETLQRSNLGELSAGDAVNLERALPVAGRFGGHIVQGHADGIGTLRRITREREWHGYEVTAPAEVLHYVVPQGSIAVDGVSLTVVAKLGDAFTVALIPHTLTVTTLGGKRVGARLNLEADILAKYVAAALAHGRGSALSLDRLAELGYGATE
jgi:riboflavin synthase